MAACGWHADGLLAAVAAKMLWDHATPKANHLAFPPLGDASENQVQFYDMLVAHSTSLMWMQLVKFKNIQIEVTNCVGVSYVTEK